MLILVLIACGAPCTMSEVGLGNLQSKINYTITTGCICPLIELKCHNIQCLP